VDRIEAVDGRGKPGHDGSVTEANWMSVPNAAAMARLG